MVSTETGRASSVKDIIYEVESAGATIKSILEEVGIVVVKCNKKTSEKIGDIKSVVSVKREGT